MIRVGIVGATGYTALELLKLLARHPEVEITVLTTRQEGQPHVAEVHPQLSGRVDCRLEQLDSQSVAERTDCVFCCLPHAASAATIEELMQSDVRVIDFSADYRLRDVSVYEQWYDQKHPNPDRMRATPYGLPELFREQIGSSQLVANPGCFPTSAILAVAPLVKANLIDVDDLIVDSKTGVSGAGRTPALAFHFPECNESVAAYKVGQHRHGPEIADILSRVGGRAGNVIFTPHLIPMDRGILTTVYAKPVHDISQNVVMELLAEFYRDEPFVRVANRLPATKDSAGSNFCDITARIVHGRVVVISCLDNLVKGASGAAVQNMNVMYGLPETLALL
ncbi:MAG: N-acetyl-gamma-glutamyl-phosphate reductase [Planctomycetales bacterium]|nr:N-acetyl-gamma-glutamyl-phosphate reductase [Planctomycetales bacterium]